MGKVAATTTTEGGLYRLLQVGFALTTMMMKWMIGVVIRKLFDAGIPSTGVEPLEPDTGDDTESSIKSKLLDFVFLFDTSFYTVVGISFAIIFVNIICTAGLTSGAVHRSAKKGRRLRHKILEKAILCAGGTETQNLGRTANDLVVNVKLLEDFAEFDEHWILVNYIIIAMALLLSITFAWQAGLVAIGCFACSMVSLYVFERIRASKVLVKLEEDKRRVNARLLDVVKNGVKIKIMGQMEQESKTLMDLEASSDSARTTNARLKFFREILRQYLLAIIPILMAMLGWHLIEQAQHNPGLALDIGSSILVAILMLDEAHKAFMHNAFIFDKQVGATEAQAAIDVFLGEAKQQETPGAAAVDSRAATKEGKARNDLCCLRREEDDATSPEEDVERGNDHDQETQTSATGRYQHTEAAKGIELAQISFGYPGRSIPVLKDYSHSFERGQIHALVGESGSGKSTLLKVIADLARPSSGSIQCWEGMKVAYVSQDQKLFARSIRENVTYGSHATVTDSQIWAALEAANIRGWVSELPHQLDEVLVRGEADVSGGQLQRLNLAHLFCVCQTADLVILDEVLSALDQTSREVLLERLGQFLQGGKTAIIITHHSEMLSICDQVHEMPSPKDLLVRSNDPTHKEPPRCLDYDI